MGAVERWTCPECGYDPGFTPEPGAQVHHSCKGNGMPQKPNILRRATNYAKAVARWKAAGSPVRSEEEVSYLHGQFCGSCERNIDGVCHHPQCGCKVNEDKRPLANKLKMATESCPLGLWQAREISHNG